MGLAARSLARNRRALAAALRGAVRGPVSTLDPPGAASATGPPGRGDRRRPGAAEAAATPEPRYALCTIGANPY